MAFCLTAPSHYLTNADLPSSEFCGIHITRILQEAFNISIHEMILKITLYELLSHLPEVNELSQLYYRMSNDEQSKVV